MIRVGVVGYGYWGPNLVRNFLEVPDAQVAVVCDRRPERLAQVQARYPVEKVVTDYDDVLRDPSIDAIAVATPVSTHYPLALQALQAGKHVLVEKPLTPTSEQALRLVDEARRRNRVLMVDHTFVYTPAVRKMRELVASGELGRCYYYDSVRVNLGLFQHDVSVIWDLAVHDLSIMDYVLRAEPRAVSATGMRHVPGQPEDIAYLTLFFDDDLIGHIHINWLAPVKVRRTLLGGSQKMIVYDDLEPIEKVKVYDRGITVNGHQNGHQHGGQDGGPNGNQNGKHHGAPNDNQNGGDPSGVYQMLIDYRTGDMWAPRLDTVEALRREVSDFVHCIQSGGQPVSDGEAGLRVVRILEAATQSMAERGRPIEINARRVAA